jgi:nucleotide-binding universal stress UspA family protein
VASEPFPSGPAAAEPTRSPVASAPHSVRRPAPYIVLVALDLSEPGGRAWRFAFDLAADRGENSEVHAVVLGARAIAPEIRDLATRPVLNMSGPDASQSDPPSKPPIKVLQHQSAGGQTRLMAMHFRTGRPHRAILDLAKDLDADIIVIATQPTTRWQRLLGGSMADRIARTAPCPVVVVRPKEGIDDPGMAQYPARG